MKPKPTPTDFPIHELIESRWSPRAFTDRSVDADALRRCFEAARWAASCFNEQPWRYLVANRDADPEGHERLAACLVEANAVWAAAAPVLILGCARETFTRNAKPNRHAGYDLGQATAQLALQATAEGLSLHQMAGFDADLARRACAIPAEHSPLVMIALGHQAAAQVLPEALREREEAPRVRRPQSEFVFGATFETDPRD